ncbi:diaminohydroxyphosphoribosylaminopyrimidine deaminase [Synechococcus sp. PCC 6312]|nr:diaminohydroxyphosphoribosylaminopyrimidine deaminase [Synechococcus sp. PCC 6312]
MSANITLHEFYMARCLALAAQAKGRTSPNPLVGCVIVQAGEIVGEGFHPQAGQPHAEVFALRAAGELAQGATLYVNLEPCNHYGRTPPCTEAVIQAGIKTVVVGLIDPDPRVSGRGVERLRQAGLEVITGVLESACRDLNEAFIHRVLHHRPFGILKYAMTLDGKMASRSGHSQWITSAAARIFVHQLRAESDAVIVGGNTVRQDNPSLTSHQVSDHNPLRVVMSRQLNLPHPAHLWQTEMAPTLVLTEAALDHPLAQILQAQGVELQTLPSLTPTSALTALGERGINTVLWESGGILSTQALREGMIQKIWAFIAPKIIGGEGNMTPFGDLGLETMAEAIALERVQWQPIDTEMLLQAYVPPRQYVQGPIPAPNL